MTFEKLLQSRFLIKTVLASDLWKHFGIWFIVFDDGMNTYFKEKYPVNSSTPLSCRCCLQPSDIFLSVELCFLEKKY